MSHPAPGATHVPLLVRTIVETTGPVIEFGAGYYSTPLLSDLCRSLGRELITVEDAPVYIELARRHAGPLHRVVGGDYTKIRAALLAEHRHYGVIFLDHSDDARTLDLAAFGPRASRVVIHDTDHSRSFPGWAYRADDRRYDPWTTVLSQMPLGDTSGLVVV